MSKDCTGEDCPVHNKGEQKHETCRFGTVEPYEIYSKVGPFVIDTGERGVAARCTWTKNRELPPHVQRSVGGLVDFCQDCALCNLWEPVEAAPCPIT